MEKIAYRCLAFEDWKDALEEYRFDNVDYSKIEDYYKLWESYFEDFCFEVDKYSNEAVWFGYCDIDWSVENNYKIVEYISKRKHLVVELL